jgi:hypothetical protein
MGLEAKTRGVLSEYDGLASEKGSLEPGKGQGFGEVAIVISWSVPRHDKRR